VPAPEVVSPASHGVFFHVGARRTIGEGPGCGHCNWACIITLVSGHNEHCAIVGLLLCESMPYFPNVVH
jgi:hypothetical protein